MKGQPLELSLVNGTLQKKALTAWEESRERGVKYDHLASHSQVTRLKRGQLRLNGLITFLAAIGYDLEMNIVRKGKKQFESDEVNRLLIEYYKHKEGIKTMSNHDQLILKNLII